MVDRDQVGLSRRAFLKFSGVIAGGALLAACAPAGAPAASSSGSSAPSAAAVTVEWWHGWGGTVALDTLQKVADAFNEEGKTFTVNRTQVDSVSDKLLTAIAGGTPPRRGNRQYRLQRVLLARFHAATR